MRLWKLFWQTYKNIFIGISPKGVIKHYEKSLDLFIFKWKNSNCLKHNVKNYWGQEIFFPQKEIRASEIFICTFLSGTPYECNIGNNDELESQINYPMSQSLSNS